MISLMGTKAAVVSTADGGMTRREEYVTKTFLTSLSTAAFTFSVGRMSSALCRGHSFCWRAGGCGTSVVARFVSASGGGFVRRCKRSRMDALCRFRRLRVWWPVRTVRLPQPA